MIRNLILAALCLCATSLPAQTALPIANPSFELAPIAALTTNANGSYNNAQAIFGWNCSGNYGLWQPAAAEFSSVPDGITVFYSNGGACTQDLGPIQPGAYTLNFELGRRGDKVGDAASCMATFSVGSTVLQQSGAIAVSSLPLGGFAPQSLAYSSSSPPAGDLILSLSGTGAQCAFDALAGTYTATPPVISTFQFLVQNSTCTKCDGTDDAGAGALGVLGSGATITIGSGASTICGPVTMNANAQASCSGGINTAPTTIPLALTIISSDGKQSFTVSQSVLGIVFVGRGTLTMVGLFDSANLQPRGMRIYTQ